MPGRRSLVSRLKTAVRAFTLSEEPPESFWRWTGVGRPTESGAIVTDQTALRVAAVLSCVRVLAEAISTLPLGVFERLDNGDRRRATEHPLDQLLHLLSNPEETAQAVRETMAAHVLLRGTAYARIARDGGGDVREIWPLTPGTVRPERLRATGELVFPYSENGVPPQTLRPDQVWRIPGLSWRGVTGLSPIGMAREAMGLAMSLETSTAAALRNGTRLGGIVTYPEALEDDEYDKRLAALNAMFSGPANTGKTFLADGGAKWESIGMSLKDFQFLELKRFQIAEIARIFRVPLHMLYDHDAQPRANMEQSSLEFVIYSLRAWLVRIEQTAARDLLLPSERARYFVEHNVAGLLRGDFAARMAGYSQGRQWGWLSANDVRRLENLNGIGEEGDVYLQPQNMAPAGTPAPAPAR